jgi:hypothetical protein
MDDFLAIANQRSNAVQDFLASQGVAPERLFLCNPEVITDKEEKPKVALLFPVNTCYLLKKIICVLHE